MAEGVFAWLGARGGPPALRTIGWVAVLYAAAVTAAFLVGVIAAPTGTFGDVVWGLLPGPWAEDIATEESGGRFVLLAALWLADVQIVAALLLWGGMIHRRWRRKDRSVWPHAVAFALVVTVYGVVDTAFEMWHGVADGAWSKLDPFGPLALVLGAWMLLAVMARRPPAPHRPAAARPHAQG